MGRPVVRLPLIIILTLPLGCGRASPPPASPGTSASAAPAATPVADANETLKAVMDALPKGGGAAGGGNAGTLQVGSHRLKTEADVPITYAMQNERAIIKLGGQTLVIEFDQGRVLLDDTERVKLPSGTKEVEVRFFGGKLMIKADGTAVFPPGDTR